MASTGAGYYFSVSLDLGGLGDVDCDEAAVARVIMYVGLVLDSVRDIFSEILRGLETIGGLPDKALETDTSIGSKAEEGVASSCPTMLSSDTVEADWLGDDVQRWK